VQANLRDISGAVIGTAEHTKQIAVDAALWRHR
jgi:hypothetical protein